MRARAREMDPDFFFLRRLRGRGGGVEERLRGYHMVKGKRVIKQGNSKLESKKPI